MPELALLFTIGVLFVLLAVAGVLAIRLEQSVISAYIIIGILVGPNAPSLGGFSLTLIADHGIVQLFADLGVVLLLFFVGLELGLDELFTNRTRFLKAGAIDVGISLPLGVVLGLAFGFSWLEAAFIALIVFNSSTVIIAKSLIELGWIVNPEGRTILGVIVIEDVLTALGFAVLSAVLLGGSDVASFGLSVGLSLLFLGLLLGASYYGTSLLERVFGVRSSELFVLGVLGVITVIAGAGVMVGVSEALAAFVVGTAFGQTEHMERIEGLIVPSRDFFAAMFFAAIGLRTDPVVVVGVGAFVVVAVVVTTAGQVVSGFFAGRAYGLTPLRAARMGTALTPRGEFSLVIAAYVATAGTTAALRETIPAFTVGYVLLTSILGTFLMRRADSLAGLFIDDAARA